jgi:hypothetical protein
VFRLLFIAGSMTEGRLEIVRVLNLSLSLSLSMSAAVCLGFSGRVYAQAPAEVVPAQPPAFEQKLRETRYELRMENGKFAGSAAPVLESAIANAQYVLIGEDHFTREIPEFATVVCDIMAPEGLSDMVVETGPQVAEFVSSTFGSPDRMARMAALTQQYPESVAFLNMRQENDLAAHCAQVARTPHFHLWGLDQEFIGSAGWLLDQILATHPGAAATAAIRRLKSEEQRDALSAKETGDVHKLFLIAAPDSELAEKAAVLRRDANSVANALFGELIESHEIYSRFAEDWRASNNQRARLLKRNFRLDLEKGDGGGGFQKDALKDPRKVLVKFGEWHLYKGYNPLPQRDLGNYIAEVADAQGSASLHICVFGAKGTRRVSGGYERPTKVEKFVLTDEDNYRWLKPAIDNQVSNAWTLYDLRKLRSTKTGAVDPGMERLIYGYDLLVIVPELTPADPVQ